MKMIRLGRVAPVLAAALGAAACNDGLTDINVNPNDPTTAPAAYVLTNAQAAAIGRGLGTNFHMTLSALWSQQFAKIQYIDEDRYDLRPATIDAHWSGFYVGPLTDFKEVMDQGTEQGRPNYTAIGNIMSVWTWHLMTDVWGDLPYSQALNGAVADGNNVTPAYDTQQAIYTDLLARLTTAQGQLSASGGDFGDADVVYEGDPAMWQRFANSLRLRLAMRMVNRNPTAARAAFEAAAALPLITSNAQNADLDYGTSQADANPIYINQQTRDDHAVSRTMVDSLNRMLDPRIGYYANPYPASGVAPGFHPDFTGAVVSSDTNVFRGMTNGISAGSDNNFPARSRIGDWFTAADAPAVLMGAAEVRFLLAEAKLRGWTIPAGYGTAEELYNAGVTLSMQEFGISGAAITAYLGRSGTSFAGAGSTAEQYRRISLQKWVALYGNGPEAYAEWRRTGVPGLAVVPGSVNGANIPVRVPYGTQEQSLNAANWQAAVAANGGDDFNDRVWWDN